jgi:hypothetical protein
MARGRRRHIRVPLCAFLPLTILLTSTEPIFFLALTLVFFAFCVALPSCPLSNLVIRLAFLSPLHFHLLLLFTVESVAFHIV